MFNPSTVKKERNKYCDSSDVVVYGCNLTILEVEVGDQGVYSPLQLHIESEASPELCETLSQKNKQTTKKHKQTKNSSNSMFA